MIRDTRVAAFAFLVVLLVIAVSATAAAVGTEAACFQKCQEDGHACHVATREGVTTKSECRRKLRSCVDDCKLGPRAKSSTGADDEM